jgi:hypothetical protein
MTRKRPQGKEETMRKSYWPMPAFVMGFLVFALSAPDVHADETIKVCVKNTAEEVMRFDVTFKESGTESKVDSHRHEKGEKCLEIPSNATDVELTLYDKTLILWTTLCSKSWPTAPTEDVRIELKESSSGLECAGI